MKLFIYNLIFIGITLLSCSDNDPSHPINAIDLVGQWKCTDVVLEFKTVNGIIDTVKYDNILYTFNSDSTYTNVNEYVLLGLPSNHGIYKYNDTLNKITFNLLFDNPLVYGLYKDVEYSWQDLKVENDTLIVKFVTKNLENNSIKSIDRKFIKI